jgi:NitT/TauT family transport system substrate-binding protein
MRARLIATLTAAILMITACGGESTAGESAGGKDQVTLGLIPILDVAPIHLGVTKGFFEEEGIELKIENAAGGAALVPAVVSGNFDFAFSNATSLIIAKSKGLPLKMVSPGASSTGIPGKDFGAIVVGKNSTIGSVKDLAGATVAINTLNNINDTLIRDAVAKAGGDPAAIRFVEIPHADMPAALASKQVDAIWEVEPFLTLVQKDGARAIYSLYAEATKDLTVAVYFTSDEIAQKNPDLVKRFDNAVKKSLTYATEHPEEARSAVTGYTKIDPAILPDLTLPAWPSTINRASIEFQAELAQRYKLIDNEVNLASLLP